MTDLFASLPSNPDEEPILCELAPEPLPAWAALSGPSEAEMIERAIKGRIAITLAIASWLPALGVIVIGPLIVYYHTHLLLLSLDTWFVPLAVLLALALVFAIVAFFRTPKYYQAGQRGTALACLSIAGVLLSVAVGVMAVCAWKMPAILLSKTDAGREQLHRQAANQGDPDLTAAQNMDLRKNRERENAAAAKLAKRTTEVTTAQAARKEAREKEETLEKIRRATAADRQRAAREAEVQQQALREEEIKRNDKPGNYRQALRLRLTQGVDSTPLPEYAGPTGEQNNNYSLDWKKLNFHPSLRPTPSAATESLVDGRTLREGFEVRRLRLAGEDFVPQAVVYYGSLWLLQTNGTLLQIRLTDLQTEYEYPLKTRCHNFNLLLQPGGGQQLQVCADDSVIRLALSRTGERLQVDASHQRVVAPRQVTLTDDDELEVGTGGEEPLIATWKGNLLTSIREQDRARSRAPGGAFAESQYGRSFTIDREGCFYVSRPEGICRGQLPAVLLPDVNFKPNPSWPNYSTQREHKSLQTATVSLDGLNIISAVRRWPVADVHWQTVVPAEGIDSGKFAQLSGNRLATCSDQHNLLIYDAAGPQISAQNFPDAGKTLGLASLSPLEMVVVFTEKRIFVVAPDHSLAQAPPKTEHYPTVDLRMHPYSDGPPLQFKSGTGRQFGDESYKVTQLPKGSQAIWGERANRLYVLDADGIIYRVNTDTWSVSNSLPLGEKWSEKPYHIDQIRWTQAGLVASMPRLHLLAVLDPDTLKIRRTFEFHAWQEPWATHPRSPWIFQSIPTRGYRFDLIDLRDGAIVTTINADKLKPKQRDGYRKSVAFGPRQESLLIGIWQRAYALRLNPADSAQSKTSWEQIELPEREFKESPQVGFAVHDETDRVLMFGGTQLVSCDLKSLEVKELLKIPYDAQIRFARDSKSMIIGKYQKEYDLDGSTPRSIDKAKDLAEYSADGTKFISGEAVYERK
ncbi:hypothetical protein [Anatilimnocola floriformis]|uniref:hypothetical protein n=1 Tax=Anatilimnocola floriformis TaxID=2948575 RepID=UPI0020C59621|nr:hypothetical protein [Anatilimnocola floriformis]